MRPRPLVAWLVAALALGVTLLVATLALPLPLWRSGDQGLAAMDYRPVAQAQLPPQRLWIDTDAACGAGPRVDPDDCLALALLVRARGPSVVGVSTVFGNASRAVVDDVTSALRAALAAEGARVPPLFFGAAEPLPPLDARTRVTEARDALIAALEAGPLAILALGPLTNIADALDARADLAPRVTRLVAVMGRRPGHLFHPAEGARAGSFLGHGPVFRDFNVAMDPRAVARILALRLPVTLVPYDAARGVEFTSRDVQALAASGGAGLWLAPRLGDWLAYWNREIGRHGFYPFDLLAAAYLLEPQRFGCAAVTLRVGGDAALMWPLHRRDALLVEPLDPTNTELVHRALYCGRAEAAVDHAWRALLGPADDFGPQQPARESALVLRRAARHCRSTATLGSMPDDVSGT